MTPPHAKILVADDNKDLLKAVSIRLWELGYEMISATDSNQVLQLVIQAKPDVLVLDVNMPAGDGFGVHERLKMIYEFRQIPVIYITGDRSSRLDAIADEIGAAALFHKPFRVKDLVTTIDRVLQARVA